MGLLALVAGLVCAGVAFADAGNPIAGPIKETSIVEPRTPSLTTDAGLTVALGPSGGDVFDTATLSGGFNPTGLIFFSLYGPNDATCANAPIGEVSSAVNGNGSYPSATIHITKAGEYRWIANYSGDRNNAATANGCGEADELFAVVDANIQISPATAVSRAGATHVLTITVNAVNGTLAAGSATAAIGSGLGSFVGSPTCNYSGGAATASCSVTIISVATGRTVVWAGSTITVSGQPITRTTGTAANTAAGGSGNASKKWADARISIGPSGTNPAGQSHTFTVLVEQNDGSGWIPADDVTINSTTSFGSITGGTCGPTGSTNGGGQCTIMVDSGSAGTEAITASGTVTMTGVSVPVATDGYGAFNIGN